MSTETHRLFFALWPDDTTRDALAAAAQAVRQRQHPTGRWNQPSRFHVTLQFLGGYPVWPDDIVARATIAAGEIATEPFALTIDRASSFGSRVWWVGSSEAPAPLSRLVMRLRDALRRHAVPHERMERFTPHVTILRDADRALAPTPVPPLVWTPDAFVLAASSTPGTGQYRVVQRWLLNTPAEADPSQPGLWDA